MRTATKRALATTAALALLCGAANAATLPGVLPAGWTGVGTAGSGTPDGDVGAIPGGFTGYTYVSTNGGANGVGALAGVGGTGSPTNGSTLSTSFFAAAAGDVLDFYFNYVTSDGSGFADYAWARLLDNTGAQAALLFTARTTTGDDTVPGFSMPLPEADVNGGNPTTILGGAPAWTALGGDSGTCYANGCGSTGWIQSLYTIATGGSYQLQFGVTNWSDTAFDSGMAIAGAKVGGVVIDPGDGGPAPVPLPAAGWLMIAGLGGLGALARRRRKAA